MRFSDPFVQHATRHLYEQRPQQSHGLVSCIKRIYLRFIVNSPKPIIKAICGDTEYNCIGLRLLLTSAMDHGCQCVLVLQKEKQGYTTYPYRPVVVRMSSQYRSVASLQQQSDCLHRSLAVRDRGYSRPNQTKCIAFHCTLHFAAILSQNIAQSLWVATHRRALLA